MALLLEAFLSGNAQIYTPGEEICVITPETNKAIGLSGDRNGMRKKKKKVQLLGK